MTRGHAACVNQVRRTNAPMQQFNLNKKLNTCIGVALPPHASQGSRVSQFVLEMCDMLQITETKKKNPNT